MSFKEDLGEALVKAVGYYNGGMTPDEAVVKSAQDMGFNMDQTDRLTEKFNTARTINYFERHPEDRTQSFDIASKEKVASIIRGEGAEKKASAASSEGGWHDYSCYDARESDYFAPPAEKEAEAPEEENPAKGYSYSSLCGIVTKRAEFFRRHAEKLREASGMVRAEIATELSKIASKVGSGYEPDERLALFKAACDGNPLLADVVSLSPEWIRKGAEAHERRVSRMNVVDLGDMQKLAEELDYLADASKRADDCDRKAEEAEARRRSMLDRLYKIAAGKQGGGAPGGSDKDDRIAAARDFLQLGSDAIGTAAKPVSAAKDVADGIVGKGLGEYIDTGFLGTKDDISAALNRPKKKDTSLADHINNLRRSTILQDLYENDPILQEADPEALANAYSTVIQSSPEVSLNKEVVRAILRQSVNSMAVSPFDVKQWADLENVLGKNKAQNYGGSKL